MCNCNHHFFEIGQVCVSRQVKHKLSDFAIANLIEYQQQGRCSPNLLDNNVIAPHPNAAGIYSHYDTPVGEVIVFTDRTVASNLTTLYFSDESNDEYRGYFSWSLDMNNTRKQPFTLGKITVTAAISEILNAAQIYHLIRQQLCYDWGNTCQSDWLLNDNAVKHQGRVVSLHAVDDEDVFIITEADRSVTTIMFAYEY
ncbi:hypothetical protein [Aggregatibacter actinomycetemcomitans]|uniref:hypothetical protein n=1 Tax=Aggregatibacter actinomycetemcomitans TaxID=714 RepID=UPI001E2C2DC5|nr:hypothetical protein [Aggregatibacter actinomycetemcomitans]